ncbi:hypothetical protein BKA70DRAFT_115084 [Coprinopsis sp. MPI-PUGE-AT-0042]|nr:hypothetical protein BKA70DRAFT_115084 [Coprinopsis sp. MPI-PUGE-AT-0042]
MSSLNRIPLPPLDMLTGYRRHQSILSSSPIRSSSPPRTPYLPGYGHYQPCIQSSPLVDVNVELPPLRYRADDPPSILAKFGRKIDNHLPASLKQASIGRASYFDTEEDLPPSSEFEVEEHAEDAEMGLPELDSAGESTPGHEVPSLSFSDSDSEQHINKTITNKPSEPKENDADEGEEEEEGFDFGNGGWRATFFRVSEERGKWKDDPVALKPTTTAGLRRKRLSRQSMPALSTSVQSQVSSVGPSSIATRTISEPLVSLQNACDGSTPGSDHSDLTLAGDVDMERCEGEVSNLDAGLAQPKQDREPSLSLVSQVTPSSSKHASPGLDVDRQEEDGYQEAAPLSRDHEDEEEAMEDSEELSPATASYGNGNGYSSPLPHLRPLCRPCRDMCCRCRDQSRHSPSFLPRLPARSGDWISMKMTSMMWRCKCPKKERRRLQVTMMLWLTMKMTTRLLVP